MRNLTYGLVAASVALVAAPAQAVFIANGTANVQGPASPTVTIGNPSQFNPGPGSVFFGGQNSGVVTGSGGFVSATNQIGNMVGTVNFSNVVGTILPLALTNFFTFGSSLGGTFNFSATSVRTDYYDTSAVDGSRSFAIYLLGNTTKTGSTIAADDRDSTLTSLTLTFNSTAGSPYSASASLAVPPAGVVPEPASWALMLAGFGLMGYSMRSARRKTAVNFG